MDTVASTENDIKGLHLQHREDPHRRMPAFDISAFLDPALCYAAFLSCTSTYHHGGPTITASLDYLAPYAPKGTHIGTNVETTPLRSGIPYCLYCTFTVLLTLSSRRLNSRWLSLLESLHTAMLLHFLYHYLITMAFNVVGLNMVVWFVYFSSSGSCFSDMVPSGVAL